MLAALERLIALRYQHLVLLPTDLIDRLTEVLGNMNLSKAILHSASGTLLVKRRQAAHSRRPDPQ
jgi:hypothetical protein